MIKLIYHRDKIALELEENKVNLWVIESPSMLTEVIGELSRQCEGEEGEFTLSEENEMLSFVKMVVMVKEPFSLEYNSRKILTKLYHEIELESLVDFGEEQQVFYQAYMAYLSKICQNCDFQLTFSEQPEIQSLLKMAEVKVDIQVQTLLEKVIEYIKLHNRLLKQTIFIFLNLKSFLTDREIGELYQECFYQKVHLILIEAFFHERREEEKICIVDKDLCVIYA